MNQQLLKKQFIARAQMLARVMTSTSNIKVTVTGTGAYRQPGLINLPAGDFSDPEWVAMLHGWIDHELGHEDETCFNVTKKATNENRLLNDFRQIVEDVRMEKSRGVKFRGARSNLSHLAELAIKRGLFAKPIDECDPLIAVQMLCLYYGRSHIIQQTCLNDYADLSKQIVSSKLGKKLMTDICAVIDKIEQAKSNADSLMLAREIMALLKDEHDKQQPNENNDEEQEGDNEQNSDDSNSDSGNSGDDDKSGQSSPQDQQADNDDSTNETGDSSDEDSGDGNSSGTSPSDQQDDQDDTNNQNSPSGQPGDSDTSNDSRQPSSQEIVEALEQLLNSDAEGLEDFHEALAEYLSEQAQEAQDEQPELSDVPEHAMVKAGKLDTFGSLDEITAKRLSGGVYQTMHKVLFDQVQSLEAPRKTGSRILNRKIAGIPSGNLNVFKRHIEQQDISAAVSVIVDASGSMGVCANNTDITRMTHANTCAFAFASGLNRSGVAVEVSYFGKNDGANYVAQIAKPYEQKPRIADFKISHSGYTPTGEMMMHTLSTLALRPEDKKMLIVLTDGDPNNAGTVVTATQLANTLGIKVIPIGICTKRVEGFSEGEFVTVDDPAELTNALRDAVKLKLFN